jgi:predicted lipase
MDMSNTLELLKEIQEQLASDPKPNNLRKRKRDKLMSRRKAVKATKHNTLTSNNGGKIADAARTRIVQHGIVESLYHQETHFR